MGTNRYIQLEKIKPSQAPKRLCDRTNRCTGKSGCQRWKGKVSPAKTPREPSQPKGTPRKSGKHLDIATMEKKFNDVTFKTSLSVNSVFKAQEKFRTELDTNPTSWIRNASVEKINQLTREMYDDEMIDQINDHTRMEPADYAAMASSAVRTLGGRR